MSDLGHGLSPASITVIEHTDWTDLVYVPAPGALGTMRQDGREGILGEQDWRVVARS